jgi:hypothetical protein
MQAPSVLDSITSDTRPVEEWHKRGGWFLGDFAVVLSSKSPQLNALCAAHPSDTMHQYLLLFNILLFVYDCSSAHYCLLRLFNRSCYSKNATRDCRMDAQYGWEMKRFRRQLVIFVFWNALFTPKSPNPSHTLNCPIVGQWWTLFSHGKTRTVLVLRATMSSRAHEVVCHCICVECHLCTLRRLKS